MEELIKKYKDHLESIKCKQEVVGLSDKAIRSLTIKEMMYLTFISDLEACEGKAVSTSEKDLRVCEVVASASLIPMEGILNDAMKKEAKYSVQFADYDMDTWTAPVVLTENRKDKVLTDGSIRKIRIEYEN